MNIKIIVYIVVILMIFSASSSIVTASDLNSLTKAIKENQNLNGILNGEGKKTVHGLARDFFDIVRYIVITGIIIYSLKLFADFRVAGDAVEMKARIKSKAIWLVLAALFSINFWSIFNFISKPVSKIKLL